VLCYNTLADELVRTSSVRSRDSLGRYLVDASHLPCQHAARSHASTACEGGADVLQAYEHAHELYRASPRWCLDWRYRGARLLAEIAALRPDIGCLQEVDQLPQFQAHLTALGCAPPPSPGLAGCGLHTAAFAFKRRGLSTRAHPCCQCRTRVVKSAACSKLSLQRRARAGTTCATCGARAIARTAA